MTVQDQMFLYCALVYERDNQDVFSAIPADRAEMIKKEVQKFERFPKEVRLNLLMKWIAYIVGRVRNPRVEMIHPTWIVEALRKEQPQVSFLILSQFSEEYQKRVVALLGVGQAAIVDPAHGPADCSDVVFQVFCNQFAPMRVPYMEPELSLETLYLLREEDLPILMKHIGVREIAWAFVLAGKDALYALVSRFPAELQKDFLSGVKSAGDNPDRQKLATKRLSKYDPASMSIEEAALRIGLNKVAAVLANRPRTARKIAQRFPIEIGQIVLNPDQETGFPEEETEILQTIHELIERGIVDKKHVDALFGSSMESIQARKSLQV